MRRDILRLEGEEDFLHFSINGVKFGLIICFELRFKELWKRLEGVDIVVAPSMWGRPRKVHLEVLAQALAIMNQSFVVVSNSSNPEMAKGSLIASPWGNLTKNDRINTNSGEYRFKRSYGKYAG